MIITLQLAETQTLYLIRILKSHKNDATAHEILNLMKEEVSKRLNEMFDENTDN